MMRWLVGGLSCGPGVCVSCSASELGWGWRRLAGLGPPVGYFAGRSGAVLLLWIFCVFFLSCVCCVFVRVYLCVPAGGGGRGGGPLGSRLWCLVAGLSLSHWCPGSGVVLDCIESLSMQPYLLLEQFSVCVCLFDLILHVLSSIFQLNRDVSSWVGAVLN